MQVVIVNQSTDPAITNDVLLQIAEALTIQIARDFQPIWQGADDVVDASATISVASADAGLPVGAVPLLIQDSIAGAPNDLAFHDVEAGIPVIRCSWSAIKQNGGSLLTGSNSLSGAASHELVELLADLDANHWVTKADGKTKLARESADPVEGNSYEIDVQGVGSLPPGKVSVSNFVYPAFFVLGSTGRLDFLGMLTTSQVADAGGYEIDQDANGTINDVFAKTVEEGGLPQWRRDQILAKRAMPGSRQHKRSHHAKVRLSQDGAITFSTGDGTNTITAGGTTLVMPYGTFVFDSTGFRFTSSTKEVS